MNKILLDNVSLQLTDKARDKVAFEVSNGSIWEYISSLINQDVMESSSIVSNSDSPTIEDLYNLLNEIKKDGVQVGSTPSSSSHEKTPPVQARPKQIETKVPSNKGGLGDILNKFNSMGRK